MDNIGKSDFLFLRRIRLGVNIEIGDVMYKWGRRRRQTGVWYSYSDKKFTLYGASWALIFIGHRDGWFCLKNGLEEKTLMQLLSLFIPRKEIQDETSNR